jgi:hypothetical protein
MDANQSRQDGLEAKYANYCRVARSRFEFMIEFGQLTPDANPPVMHTRIVLNPSSALALYRILADSIWRYRAEFGPIRTVDNSTESDNPQFENQP